MAEWALSHNSGYAAGCVSYCKERGNNTSSSIDKEMDEIQDSVKTIWLLLFYFVSFIKLCQTKLYCLLLVNMFILYLVWHCIVVYLHASLWWYAMRTVQCMHLVHWHQYQCVFNQQIALWTLGQLVESTG